MQDRGVPTDALPANKGDKEFALSFYIAQRTDAALADAFIVRRSKSRKEEINAGITSSWGRKRGVLKIWTAKRRRCEKKF